MTSKEFTSILREKEKSLRNGLIFGHVKLPKNSLGIDMIYYNPILISRPEVNVVSSDCKIDMTWSQLKKREQKELIEIVNNL